MPSPSDLVPVTVYLQRELAERYRDAAAAADRTISAECRRALVRAAELKGEGVDLAAIDVRELAELVRRELLTMARRQALIA